MAKTAATKKTTKLAIKKLAAKSAATTIKAGYVRPVYRLCDPDASAP
jgi:hypothetical protein